MRRYNPFRRISCLTLIFAFLCTQFVLAAQSSPAVLVRNKNHFEPEQSAGDKFPSLDSGEFTDANTPAGITTYDYDLNGNLTKITDAHNNPTAYAYDLFDRLDVTQYANLSSSDFDYDKNSNLTRHTTPGGKPIDYDYDALNRLTAKRYPLTASLDTNYTYDLGGRLTDADNVASQIHHDHDALSRVTTTAQHLSPNTYNLSYQYDSTGNRTQLVYPSAKTLDYTYDANDRLTGITHNTLNFLQYQYDPLDRRTTKSYLSTSLPLSSYSYDIGNQLSSVTNTLVNGTPVSQYAYPVYDNVGNRKQLDRTLQTQPTQSTGTEGHARRGAVDHAGPAGGVPLLGEERRPTGPGSPDSDP